MRISHLLVDMWVALYDDDDDAKHSPKRLKDGRSKQTATNGPCRLCVYLSRLFYLMSYLNFSLKRARRGDEIQPNR